MMRLAALTVTVLLLAPAEALAVNVEPGSLWATGSLGPGIKLGSELGGSPAYLLLSAQAEYDFNKSLAAVGGLNFGLSGTFPIKGRIGVRYRLADLELPISPYAQLQFSGGTLYDVVGANLGVVGAFVGAGADYLLTSKLSIGGIVGVDLMGTTGERPAFYGTVEIMVAASYLIF